MASPDMDESVQLIAGSVGNASFTSKTLVSPIPEQTAVEALTVEESNRKSFQMGYGGMNSVSPTESDSATETSPLAAGFESKKHNKNKNVNIIISHGNNNINYNNNNKKNAFNYKSNYSHNNNNNHNNNNSANNNNHNNNNNNNNNNGNNSDCDLPIAIHPNGLAALNISNSDPNTPNSINNNNTINNNNNKTKYSNSNSKGNNDIDTDSHCFSWTISISLWISLIILIIFIIINKENGNKHGTDHNVDTVDTNSSSTNDDDDDNDGTVVDHTSDPLKINETTMVAFVIIVISLYIFNFIEFIVCSSTMKYLKHVKRNKKELIRYLESLKNNVSPIFSWHVECYHYQNSDHSRVTIPTHEANMNYKYNKCYDISDSTQFNFDLSINDENNQNNQNNKNTNTEKCKKQNKNKNKNSCNNTNNNNNNNKNGTKLLKLTLKKQFLFGDWATKRDFETKKNQFRMSNSKDDHQEFKQKIKLHGFKSKILAIWHTNNNNNSNNNISKSDINDDNNNSNGNISCLLTPVCFFITSCLVCSPCYRRWLSKKCERRTVIIRKVISI